MKNGLFFVAFLALPLITGLGGCKDKIEAPAAHENSAADAGTGSSSAAAKPAEGRHPGKRITPERIAEIKAAGRTGFWSDIDAVCPGTREATTLTWNIDGDAARRFIVYVVDKDGVERNFGQGGAVGEKRTGPWLRPGLVFKLRAADDKQEAGNISIAKKEGC